MSFNGLTLAECAAITCPVCFKFFDEKDNRPTSLGCGHTLCKNCIKTRLQSNRCPFDQVVLPDDINELPANFALMHLLEGVVTDDEPDETPAKTVMDSAQCYELAQKYVEEMGVHLKPLAENPSDDEMCSEYSSSNIVRDTAHEAGKISNNNSSVTPGGASKCVLSRPVQRKLISLLHCQLLEDEGRARAARIARSLGERIVSELLTLHQFPHQLSANLWAAVRTRGCQFLGPAMQEEVLKLILLALEDSSFLSRKVLVLFVVQRLEAQYPQASKTAIGHVVQLLYRASCFKVIKRDEESSLMQLKEEFCQYEALRREHDSQIVQIAIEAGLRISPDQWSSLLYGDSSHKSHMQSIIDKHQSPQTFGQMMTELLLTLQRGTCFAQLSRLKPQLEFLSSIDPNPECPAPSWENMEAIMRSLNMVVTTFVEFLSQPDLKVRIESTPAQNTRYKTSMCRDFLAKGSCPRGNTCTFAHSHDELERFRSRSRRNASRTSSQAEKTSSCLTPEECDQLRRLSEIKLLESGGPAGGGNLGADLTQGSSNLGHCLDSSVVVSASPDCMSSTQYRDSNYIPGVTLKGNPTSGVCNMNMRRDTEINTYIPPPPVTMSTTQLTFTQMTVKAPESMRAPLASRQTCYHPHDTGPTPFVTHMSANSCPHPQHHHDPSGMMVQPPPSLNTSRSSYFVPMNTSQCPPRLPVQPVTHHYHYPHHSLPMRIPLPSECLPADSNRQISTQSSCLHDVPPPSHTNVRLMTTGMTSEATHPSSGSGQCCNCQADISSCTHCMPCWGEEQGHGASKPHERMMLSYPVQEETLEDLNSRKQELITHLHEEPVFMGSKSAVYRADSERAGFDGLKTVLGNNKRTREAMPQLVSDIFVATRSTQSLDQLLQDDLSSFVKWSIGEDVAEPCCYNDLDLTPTNQVMADVTTSLNLPFPTQDGETDYEHGVKKLYNPPQSSVELVFRQINNKPDDSEFCCNGVSHEKLARLADLDYELFRLLNDQYDESEFSRFPGDDNDENFFPMEHACVSKFGPISRMAKVKTDNVAVQVTADSCRKMTPGLGGTSLERPLSASSQRRSRFTPFKVCDVEPPSVKPTPSEKPSVWQQSPCPSYENIALLKAGAAEAVTNNERLAYELQAVELEISMKTGKTPEPVRKMVQEAVMQTPLRMSSDQPIMCPGLLPLSHDKTSNMSSVMGRGHVTECFTQVGCPSDNCRNRFSGKWILQDKTMSNGESLVSPYRASNGVFEEYYRSWQGVKK